MDSPIEPAPTAKFGFNLFKGELGANAGKNVIVSPVSVSTALGMTASGARGKTLREMNAVLCLPNDGDNSASYANLLAELQNSKLGVKLAIANAIWARAGVKFQDAFFAGARKHFGAQINVADFADAGTLAAINKWVKDNTEKKIDKILDELDPAAAMVLLNALYFKGEWSTKFDKALTKDATFHAADGDKQHPLMHRKGSMRYAQTKDYQIVALPFGEAKRVHLYVVLPKDGKTVGEVAKTLDGNNFLNACYGLEESEGLLWLPRFKLDYKAELSATLTALGMGSAFAGADFSGMRKEKDLFISKVVHKVVASFDEEGGELAAVTAVVMSRGCARISTPWQMRVDRPFIAILADEDTQAVIGSGAVLNP